jgi:hypothetical protein
MVDEVILEKESIYFNPDNQPIPVKEHDFQGETPLRGTVHSRATFDPYNISPMKERLTSSNNFKFREFWDKKFKDSNMTFGSVAQPNDRLESGTIGERPKNFSPLRQNLSFATAVKSPPRDSKIGLVKDLNNNVKSQKKTDNISTSHLSQLSNHYYDDYDRRITQRYYLLLHGHPVAIDAQFSFNLFQTSPTEKTDLKISLIIRNIFLEYTNDLMKNLAKATLAYRLENIHNRLFSSSLISDRKAYQRKLEFHTVIMYLTKRDFENYKKGVRKSPEREIVKEEKDYYDIDEEWRGRKERKRDKRIQKQLIAVDKMLRNVNFKFTFKMDEFRMDALTDVDSIKHKYKRHIFQIKTDPMLIRMLKQGLESGISGLGITFTTRNSFEML